jgi:pimeloyl-ACP methyl ester carboxylesterase
MTRTLVFIHGAAMSSRVWVNQTLRYGAAGHTVLTPDLPGCGATAGPHLPHIEAMADWLWTWIGRRVDSAVALVGHSMGGLVAVRAAALFPGRVTHLALVGSMVPLRVGADFLDLSGRDEPRAFALMEAWCAGEREPRAGLASPGMDLVRAAAPGTLRAGLAACDAYHGGAADLARYSGPAALIVGARDLMVPLARAQKFAESMPGMAVTGISGAGHNLPLEAPAAVNAALDALLLR